ncbi:MAG: DEAD/DEAH box helicase [Deltaproteobacteria bacterium]|nr:DEAD/DEAH box helicase [Deltaproteobacteria bacterium]
MNQETRPRPSARGFETLDLDPELIAVLQTLGYTEPTPIQREAIPHALEARDVLACAQTGTGKTAAFALPILDELLRIEPDGRRRPIRALVLAPTRELAAQIAESFRSYTPGGRIRCEVVFGGVGKRPQVTALRRGVDVLVATPGRLLDLMGDGEVDLSQVEMFVLDEADRMLDMGFIPDVRRITKALPRKRQMLLFSATQPREIRELASRLLYEPVEVAVDPVSSIVEPISQSVYFVDGPRKLGLLLTLLASDQIARALVFTRTKRRADRLARSLSREGVEAAAIHGDKSQSTRVRTLDAFKRGRTRVLVATDVAARGIHVEDIDTVINFDIPNEPETYVHRVGRTGRLGASGTALSLCGADEREQLAAIERLTRRKIPKLETPTAFQTTRGNQPAARPDRERRPHARRRSGNGASSRRSSRGRGRRPNSVAAGARPV